MISYAPILAVAIVIDYNMDSLIILLGVFLFWTWAGIHEIVTSFAGATTWLNLG